MGIDLTRKVAKSEAKRLVKKFHRWELALYCVEEIIASQPDNLNRDFWKTVKGFIETEDWIAKKYV